MIGTFRNEIAEQVDPGDTDEVPQEISPRLFTKDGSQMMLHGFFSGMIGKKISADKYAFASPSVVEAWQRYVDLIEHNSLIVKTREDAVQREMTVMGNVVLEVGHEVKIIGGLPARIIKVTTGYMDRPYYKCVLKKTDGSWGDKDNESECGFFYARNFEHYGLSIWPTEKK